VEYARRGLGTASRSRLVEHRADLALRADGGVRFVVIADTHSVPHPRAVELASAQRPDAILHAGDIGDVEVLEPFRAIAPLLAVRGNIDGRGPELPDELEIQLVSREPRGRGAVTKILLLHIAVNGPRLRADAARSAARKGAQLVVCGHSHVPFIGVDRGLTVFNPGSIGPRRFSLPIVFGVIDMTPAQLRMWHVDCETGARWLPPRS
jgi:uncharacterized protein